MAIRIVVMIPLVMAMRMRSDGRPSGRGQLIPSTRSRSLPREADFEAWHVTVKSHFTRYPRRHRITRTLQQSKELEEIFTSAIRSEACMISAIGHNANGTISRGRYQGADQNPNSVTPGRPVSGFWPPRGLRVAVAEGRLLPADFVPGATALRSEGD